MVVSAKLVNMDFEPWVVEIGECIGQILTLIEISTRFPPPRASLLCQQARLTYKTNMGPRRKP